MKKSKLLPTVENETASLFSKLFITLLEWSFPIKNYLCKAKVEFYSETHKVENYTDCCLLVQSQSQLVSNQIINVESLREQKMTGYEDNKPYNKCRRKMIIIPFRKTIPNFNCRPIVGCAFYIEHSSF